MFWIGFIVGAGTLLAVLTVIAALHMQGVIRLPAETDGFNGAERPGGRATAEDVRGG